jgi:type IV pilus assembly protein PilV
MNPLPEMLRRTARGFTLVEVMVSLIVIAVGLLGIASMQALALSSASNARMRSLAAIEAASLAASMHADRGFWVNQAGAANITIIGPNITADSTGFLASTAVCDDVTAMPCATDQIAAYDMQHWAVAVNRLLPTPTTNITCAISVPLSCTVDMKWVEGAVGINKQTTAAGLLQNNEYVLYVQP